MYKSLLDFLNKNEMLVKNKFGFREKHSTYMAILDVVDKISQKNRFKELLHGYLY